MRGRGRLLVLALSMVMACPVGGLAGAAQGAAAPGAAPPPAAAPAPPHPLTVYSLDPIPGLEYVAIAPLAWADHLQPLLAWKTQKGVPAQVFPLEYILSSFPGRDSAEKLHNFLRDLYFNKAPTAQWLLLVGDGDWDNPIIPDREVFTNSQQDGNLNNSQNWYTTDTYYGNLDSTWDENNNGIFGELNEGDWTPELYVGRVPLDNVSQVDTWVARELTYEEDPPQGIWMRQGILAGALMDKPNILDDPSTKVDEGYDPFTDNARKVSEEVAAEVPPGIDLQRFYDYPFWDGGQYTPATDNLVVGAVKTALDGGASFMLMEGHGYTSNKGVAQYSDPAGIKSIFRSDGEDPALRYDEVYNLTNGDRLPFVYVSACYAGDFTDHDDTSFEAFLKADAGGAVGVVAGNGENFRLENVSGQQGFGNWWLAREFFHMMFEENYSQPGKVLGDLKERYNNYYLTQGPTDAINRNYFRAERVSYNLMGDPEFSVITGTPAQLAARTLHQPLVGENTVQVAVDGRGGALTGALVHLQGPGGDVHARTNATGVATLPYAVTDTTPFNITVTAAGHLPLFTSAIPAVPEHNLAFAPPGLTVPGLVKRNETFAVTATVEAAGLTPFANVAVAFREGDPNTGTVLAALVLPAVDPGAPRQVTASLTFPNSGDVEVFASIDPAGEQTEDTRADNLAFATVHVDAPPIIQPLPTVTIAEGAVMPDALHLESYVTDAESGAFSLGYRVTFVGDPLLEVDLVGTHLSVEARPGVAPNVTVEVEVSDGLEAARGAFSVLVTKADLPPSADPVGAVTAFVGEPFVMNLTARDPEGANITWTDGSALFDVTPEGRVAFTPTASQVGTYAVAVTASDGRFATTELIQLTVERRETAIVVRNPPIVRTSPGHEVVLDLAALSSDPEVTFVADSGEVRIDNATRTLHYTPAQGDARVETLKLTAFKPGLPERRVTVQVDVAAAPQGAAGDLAVFAVAGVGVAGLVALTLVRAHSGRLRDERIFRIEGKRPKRRSAAGGKDRAAGRGAGRGTGREEE